MEGLFPQNNKIPSNLKSFIISEISPINIEMNNKKKEANENLSYYSDKLEEVIRRITILEGKVNNFTEKLDKKLNESNNSQKKENIIIREKNYYNDSIKNNNKNTNLIDFITFYEKERLGFNYYEPYEIEKENQSIVEKIKNAIFEFYLPEEENCENEMAGNFLYSVGGISRQSLYIANDIFSELFNEYKKYLEKYNEWLTFNHEEDRRKLSIWVKRCLNENKLYEYYSKLNEYKIKKYLYSNEEKSNQILLELFGDLIKLYTKCLLSYPLVEVNFINNNCKFEISIMFDIIIKGKKKFANFCYLPGLKSNGKLIKGGNFYVFTFIKGKTYQKNGNLFDDETVTQNSRLYTIPNFSNMIIDVEINSDYKIKTLTSPKIPSELKPIYKFITIEGENNLIIDENNTGIFQIEDKYLNDKFYINISDYTRQNKDSKIYKIDQNKKNISILN